MKIRLIATGVLLSAGMHVQAADPEYVMSCEELSTQQNLEITAEGRERFADLSGSCLGVVDRDGVLYLHTKMVVRRVRGNKLTLYIPANDATIEVSPDSDARVEIAGSKVRPRDLVRGQELNLYVSVDKFMQPVVDEILMHTESDDMVSADAEAAMALPTTG